MYVTQINHQIMITPFHFLRRKMNLKVSTYKNFLNSFPDVDKTSNFELYELYELAKFAILFAAWS